MKTFDAAALRGALPFERLLPLLRDAFARGCDVPQRQVLALNAGVTSLVMPAWDARRYGVKVVNVAPGNAALDLPALQASYLLFDAATGAPLALIDGGELTARRTAAVSALAASLLRPAASARRLLVVGAGRVASLLPDAYRAALDIAGVAVWARDPAKAAAALPGAVLASDLEAAVRGADIVACATHATEPLVRGAWLRSGSHLDLIGSWTPAMREADAACFAGADVFIDSDEALHKSGDLIGVVAAADVRGTLAQLARGGPPPRSGTRTVFKSVGTALADLAAASALFDL